MNIKYIDKNFNEEVLNKKGTIIVDFFAPWCGPCKMFEPIFESVAKKHENIKFYKFNTDTNDNNIAKSLNIMSIPTIILFKDGIESKRIVGFINEDELEKIIGE